MKKVLGFLWAHRRLLERSQQGGVRFSFDTKVSHIREQVFGFYKMSQLRYMAGSCRRYGKEQQNVNFMSRILPKKSAK